MAEEKKEEMGEKMVAPADFSGPMDKRGCTDILCLLLIIAHWVAMTALGAFAVSSGDYRLVLNPMDIAGNVCGIKYGDNVDMTDYPYLYYINYALVGVCVSECPKVSEVGGSPAAADPFTTIGTEGVISITGGNDFSGITMNAAAYDFSTTCDGTNTDADCFNPTGDYVSQGKGYAFFALDTVDFMNRCSLSANATIYLEEMASTTAGNGEEEGFLSKLYSDLWTGMTWILGAGFCIAMVISFVYTYLLRIPGVLFLLIWGCIAAVFAMLLGMGGYAYNEQQLWRDADPRVHDDTEADALLYVGYFFMGCSGVWFLLICFLRKRIQLALAIVKEAAKAIQAMTLIIVFPVMQCAGFVIFMVVWMVYAVYLASLGDPTTTGICTDILGVTETLCDGISGAIWIPYQEFIYDDDTTKMGWYLLFCYFWSSQFIIAVGQIVIAMCVAKWYFCRDKSTISSATVFSSIKDSFYYHTGTAAFGSLLIAIIKMIRAAIAYAQKKAKQSGNKAAQAILCALQCYMWCMEKCMKFLNKNAYIQTAIFGTHFCASAKNAFFLILRNIARIGACTIVSEFVIIIGKMFICVITGGIAYMGMGSQAEAGEIDLNSPIGPVVMIMILSWFTASMFMNIFGMAISTILQCFIADEEMFDPQTRFAEAELASFIDANGAPPKAEKEDNTL
jgi:choline transporter-like protein 2/4/5